MEKKSWISVWLMVLLVFLCCVQERAADDSKEVEGFQQLLLARTQVNMIIVTVGHSAVSLRFLMSCLFQKVFIFPFCK